jgi:hypothetical protein
MPLNNKKNWWKVGENTWLKAFKKNQCTQTKKIKIRALNW